MTVQAGNVVLKKGEIITIDGSTGQVLAGARADGRARACRASSAR